MSHLIIFANFIYLKEYSDNNPWIAILPDILTYFLLNMIPLRKRREPQNTVEQYYGIIYMIL